MHVFIVLLDACVIAKGGWDEKCVEMEWRLNELRVPRYENRESCNKGVDGNPSLEVSYKVVKVAKNNKIEEGHHLRETVMGKFNWMSVQEFYNWYEKDKSKASRVIIMDKWKDQDKRLVNRAVMVKIKFVLRNTRIGWDHSNMMEFMLVHREWLTGLERSRTRGW